MERALGFSAGALRLAPAFTAPAQAWPELEAHLAAGGEALVVCDGPASALAGALEAGARPAEALEAWADEARRLLAACETHGGRIAMILADDACAAPREAREALARRFGIEADEAALGRCAADALYLLIAAAFVAAYPHIAPLAAALGDRAQSLTGASAAPADPEGALAALAALAGEAAAAREDAAVLRAHLHLVQSQVETYYRRARDAAPARAGKDEARIAALKSELAAARAEADSYRASLSWRLTAPVRALAKHLPRGLSPAGLRLRRHKALIEESGLFDGEWYLRQYGDLDGDALDPAEHYLRFGWREGRRPGPDFDGPGYLRVNPDVAGQGVNPLVHYLLQGRDEGRPLAPRLARTEPF